MLKQTENKADEHKMFVSNHKRFMQETNHLLRAVLLIVLR